MWGKEVVQRKLAMRVEVLPVPPVRRIAGGVMAEREIGDRVVDGLCRSRMSKKKHDCLEVVRTKISQL